MLEGVEAVVNAGFLVLVNYNEDRSGRRWTAVTLRYKYSR